MTNAEILGVLQLTKAIFSRVIETFCINELVAQHVKFDGVVTLVDCKHAMQHLNAVKPRRVVSFNGLMVLDNEEQGRSPDTKKQLSEGIGSELLNEDSSSISCLVKDKVGSWYSNPGTRVVLWVSAVVLANTLMQELS
ncbi:COBW domain-containing protein 1-like [Canna indica]|uniref:COBW domain-containing protein 1-like n=1 Tax=Canna indica TaxID=4628 RepID=A0AAQ3KGL3_9LILI|nr:COBW domain-containing protein 1-like [Canna indica]